MEKQRKDGRRRKLQHNLQQEYLKCSKQGLCAASGLVSFANLNERCQWRIAPPGSGQSETRFGMQLKFGTWSMDHGRQLTSTDLILTWYWPNIDSINIAHAVLPSTAARAFLKCCMQGMHGSHVRGRHGTKTHQSRLSSRAKIGKNHSEMIKPWIDMHMYRSMDSTRFNMIRYDSTLSMDLG